MATTSSFGSGQKQPTSSSSRFSSLKVFKFAAVSSKNTPPIPPPKENVPTNTSLVSLTTVPSTPSTPVSPDYTRSQSTPPFPITHSPALSSQDSTSASSSTSFGKGLIKLAKRSLTPKSVTRQLSEESSISMPWNFQHNLHVDEGYNGLPPSWVASLANLGYSEDEIEAINYRRTASRAPSTIPFQHPNFPNLPSTSQLSILTTTTTQNPRDRVTPSPSIRRRPSQASIQSRGTRRTRKVSTETSVSRQSFYQSSSGNNSAGDLTYVTDDLPPPLPSKPPVQLNGHTHKPKKSIDTLASGLISSGPSSITRSKSSYDFLPIPPQAQTQTQPQPRSRPSQSRAPSKDSIVQVGKTTGPMGPLPSRPPRTPPRSASQTFRVVNNDALSQSPPPAYHLDDSLPISVVEKPSSSSSQSRPLQPQTPQPQLRETSSTKQRQMDSEPRASVMSTSTITPGSDPVDQSPDQLEASGISATDLAGGEDDEGGENPTSLPPLQLSVSSLSMSPVVSAKKKKRYSLAPPRLSLGQDAFADIGSWGDGLFDSLSTGMTTMTTVDGSSDATPGSGSVKNNARVYGGTGMEKRKPETSSGAAGSNSTSMFLASEDKENDEKKESNGPHDLTSPPSSLISPSQITTRKAHQPSQSSFSQSQTLDKSRSRPAPPPKTAPVIPIPHPPTLSTTTSSSVTSTFNSDSLSKMRVLPSTTTNEADRFIPPKLPLEPPRGRTGPHPPQSVDSSLPRTSSATSISEAQSQPPRERSSSRASAVRRPLPPQKPLPTRSLMSPMPLPNPPSHVELKGKISTVSLKAAAKRDKEKERERENEGEKLGNVRGGVENEKEVTKKDEKAQANGEAKEERWPLTAKERVELMASINHDNDGLDFGELRKNQDTSATDLNKTTSTVSLDPHHSYDVRDSHLSADSTLFDPNRQSSASAGSRGSTRSSSGTGLKLILKGSDFHNDNRDSNVSTSTITHATIVSGPVEVLMRARADLVVSPGTPIPRSGLSSAGSPSPAMLDAPSPAQLLTEGGSRETTPKQTSPSVSIIDVTDDERSHGGFGGRSPSPDSSTNSHSSSSAITTSSTGPSSLSSANRAAGFVRPTIKHHSGSECEEGVKRTVVSGSPLASPHKSEFDDRSDLEEDGDEIEIGDEEEEAVIPEITPPLPGSRKGSVGLVDDMTSQRRPSLVVSPISPYSLMPHEPLSDVVSVSKVLSPLDSMPHSARSGGSSPVQRYPGWVSSVLSKIRIEIFVDEQVDPRDYFEGLTEVAEGESGFVYQAKVVRSLPESKLVKRGPQPGGVVAIKAVPILPSGSSKLEDLRREVEVLKRVFEDDRSAATSSPPSGYPAGMAHVLIMEAMYVDLQEDSLWIRMELMERSLADVVALVEQGHLERIDEKVAARFASDIVQALSYLHGLGIAHRDLRSDNLLLNRDGVLKIADFSNAVTVTPESSTCTGFVGVIYWQAPEVRAGTYCPMKADIWSLGATIWEMAESMPPFHDAVSMADLKDRWPTLTRAGEFSRSLHDFLTLCSNPVASRPDSSVLLQAPFMRNAARRSVIIQILKKCRTIENLLAGSRPSVDSQGSLSRR